MAPNDAPITIDALQEAVRQFRDDRDWRQFHSPKNLSMSIAIEAAELMEHFQWLTSEASAQIPDVSTKEAIADELADVLIYCISLADILDCDIGEIIFNKLEKNSQKYPVEKFRGRF